MSLQTMPNACTVCARVAAQVRQVGTTAVATCSVGAINNTTTCLHTHATCIIPYKIGRYDGSITNHNP